MTTTPQISVSVDEDYAVLLGKAVYVFAYYEWTVVSILGLLRPGFVGEYARNKSPITSGILRKKFQEIINHPTTSLSKVTKPNLQDLCDEFGKQVKKRNALLHAHPATAQDGSQFLVYQAAITRKITDMQWPRTELEAVIREFDTAACNAAKILDRLREPREAKPLAQGEHQRRALSSSVKHRHD